MREFLLITIGAISLAWLAFMLHFAWEHRASKFKPLK